jgi:Choline/Carnitine o-acyltransferase
VNTYYHVCLFEVVVLYKNQFYYFPVLWPEKNDVAVDEGDILEILRAIVTHADANTSVEDASKTALGGLTSLPRSEWAVSKYKHSHRIRKKSESIFLCTLNSEYLHLLGCSKRTLSIKRSKLSCLEGDRFCFVSACIR